MAIMVTIDRNLLTIKKSAVLFNIHSVFDIAFRSMLKGDKSHEPLYGISFVTKPYKE